MKELSDHTDIIITKADKGGAVVIMNVKDYINEAHRQLNNKDDYKILNKDPTTTNAKLDQQTYLHAQSNHPKSLKDSIPYSQALHIKTIFSTTSEFKKKL